jgi:hypothetical protein
LGCWGISSNQTLGYRGKALDRSRKIPLSRSDGLGQKSRSRDGKEGCDRGKTFNRFSHRSYQFLKREAYGVSKSVIDNLALFDGFPVISDVSFVKLAVRNFVDVSGQCVSH